jgi:hypothetical protein
MHLQKVIKNFLQKNFLKKKHFFVGILKTNDENSRLRIRGPDPDPLVRIRIH